MYLLRHGQSLFNLHFSATRRDPGIEDPALTPLGEDQARKAANALAGVRLTRIIISPYTRALQTAEPILASHNVPVHIMHEVRERTAFVCDIGSNRDQLSVNFPHHSFDHLPDRWWSAERETTASTIARADAFRRQIAARDDTGTTLLVSHWGFILALTGISVENGEILIYDPLTPAPETIRWSP